MSQDRVLRLHIAGRTYRLGIWLSAPSRRADGALVVDVISRPLDPLPLAPGMVTWPARRRRRRRTR